jgi:hypothetical protein
VLAAGAAWAAPRADAQPLIFFSTSFSAGHDDQVLAEPERRGVIEAMAEDFGSVAGKVHVGGRGLSASDRFMLTGEASGTRYGSGDLGDDAGVRLSGVYRRNLDSRLMLDGQVSWWQFRRAELTEFNLDLTRTGARLAWAPASSWLVTAGGRHSWVQFPGRQVLPDTSLVEGEGGITVVVTPVDPHTESDRQTDLQLAVLRRVGGGAYVSMEYAHRWSESNAQPVDFQGPLVTLRAGNVLPGSMEIVGYVGYSRRDFPDLHWSRPAPGADPVPTRRRDDSWHFGFTLDRPLSDRVSLFADGTWLDQSSSVDDFTFDQARITMGISVGVWRSGDPRRPLDLMPRAERHPFTPVATLDGIRFRISAPVAEEVSLVGDFNAWDPARTRLEPLGNGEWEALVTLAPGIWRYAFVVDGVWTRPPAAPLYEPDGFGGENGILNVSDGEPAAGGAVTENIGERPKERVSRLARDPAGERP